MFLIAVNRLNSVMDLFKTFCFYFIHFLALDRAVSYLVSSVETEETDGARARTGSIVERGASLFHPLL